VSYIPPPPAQPPRIPGEAPSGHGRPSFSRHIAALPKPALVGGLAALALGGSYLIASLALDDTIAAGTSVHGVDIGGLSPQAAKDKLATELADELRAPLKVFVGEIPEDPADPYLLDPIAAGLSLDLDGTVAQADRPGVLGRLFGGDGGELDPVVELNEEQGRAELETLAEDTGTEHVEGGITFADGQPQVTEPSSGATLNVDDALERLTENYPAPAAPVSLPVTAADPLVDEEEVARALREFAEPAMSAPVVLTAGSERISLTPEMLGDHLSMEPDEQGRLEPRLDGEGLAKDKAVRKELNSVTRPAVNARLGLQGGEVVVTADAQTGFEVVTDNLGELVLPLLTEEGTARTAQASTRETTPELTRENVRELGITEQMSTFTITFDPAPYRITNIGRAAELINGSLVAPGDIWSFNETVGERTKENGFVEGVIILDDQYQTAQGGGVSAVATTMFNAVFFAGVKPVEYGAHSFYIERYPEGREATVAWGHLDNRFENDSGNSIYILASSTDSSVTISFLGTRKYDEVESVTGKRTNVVEPGKREGVADDCVAQPPLEGFDVVVERVFKNDGKEVRREEFKTRYTPRDEVV
jgi:vancomycin resistance protein YoaR